MKIILTGEEVQEAIANYISPDAINQAIIAYAADKGLTLSASQIGPVSPDGEVALNVETLIPAGGTTTAAVKVEEAVTSNTSDDTETPEPAPATTSGSIWDRASWIQLRKTGFTKLIMDNIDSLAEQGESLIEELKEKWGKIHGEELAFPSFSKSEPVEEEAAPATTQEQEPADTTVEDDSALFAEEAKLDAGSKTVQDVIAENANGDVTEKEAPDLSSDEDEDDLFG